MPAMTLSKPNVSYALVGPGAIGLYYGGLLANSGAALHVLARSDYQVLEASGISIRMIDPTTNTLNAEHHVKPVQVAQRADEIGAVDYVIIAAKATVNAALIESLCPLIACGRTVVLTLQNGMGNADFFAKHFPQTPMLAGLCFVCANRTAPGVVENYLPGRVEIGSLHDAYASEALAMVELFNQAGIRTNHSSSLNASLWRKLCWNIPFNGLSIAAGGITTDKILGDPNIVQRARRLMQEVQQAAALDGHAIPDSFLQGQFDVTERMGAYQPSSLIDFLEARAVEIDAIWGEPLRRGQALGAAMPELEQLTAEITAAVERSRS